MNSWILYIIKCSDDSLYTGITTDLDKRLRLHSEGKAAKYTRTRLPVKVVHKEAFSNESLARRREIEIKGLTRTDKLKLIQRSQ